MSATQNPPIENDIVPPADKAPITPAGVPPVQADPPTPSVADLQAALAASEKRATDAEAGRRAAEIAASRAQDKHDRLLELQTAARPSVRPAKTFGFFQQG